MYSKKAPVWPKRAAVLAAVALTAIVAYSLGAFGGDDRAEQVSTVSVPSSVDVDEELDAAAVTDPTVTSTNDEATTSVTTERPRPTPVPSDPITPSSAAPDPPGPATYPTLPDGRPVPVLAIFDGELITLSGTVPSESAAQRLRVLALANSTVADAEVASFLAVDPSVPIGVGVRVIEMNSARFPEGSPLISPEHAVQLDRVAAIMTALPNITVEVIGHADQRGDDETNFALSAERARAAADYVASRGVDPSRLSSRGAGESDLLSLNDDDAALALNRRTEFVFSGLLLEAPEPT